MTLRKELQKALGHNYEVSAGLEIMDRTREGYDHWRNVAQLKERDGKILANIYRGKWYRASNVQEYTDIRELIRDIRIARSVLYKENEGNGEDAQTPNR